MKGIFLTPRNQQTGENIDAYVTDLKNKASLCEFDALKDSLIKDRIVCGVRSDEVRARLLRVPDLSLEKAIDICRAAETSETQLKSLAEEKPIDFLHKRGYVRPKQKQVKKEATQQKVKQPSKESSPNHTNVKNVDILMRKRNVPRLEKSVTTVRNQTTSRKCVEDRKYMLWMETIRTVKSQM